MKTKILLLTLSLLTAAALTGCKPHEADNSPATPPAEPSAPASTNGDGTMTPAATNSMPAMNPTNTSPGSTNQ